MRSPKSLLEVPPNHLTNLWQSSSFFLSCKIWKSSVCWSLPPCRLRGNLLTSPLEYQLYHFLSSSLGMQAPGKRTWGQSWRIGKFGIPLWIPCSWLWLTDDDDDNDTYVLQSFKCNINHHILSSWILLFYCPFSPLKYSHSLSLPELLVS